MSAVPPVSKTQRKKEMHALQALGAELVELPESQLEALALPEHLAQAVRELLAKQASPRRRKPRKKVRAASK